MTGILTQVFWPSIQIPSMFWFVIIYPDFNPDYQANTESSFFFLNVEEK